jgi:transposase
MITMRFAGVDIGSQTHVVAIVDAASQVVVKPTSFTEDAVGYEKFFRLLGSTEEVIIGIEATGHYWLNLFAHINERGYRAAVINPLRTRRFAEEDLMRAKTDPIDSLGIARFVAQKRPPVTSAIDIQTDVLHQTVQLRDRLVQDCADRLRQLHRAVDLGFPEFTRLVRTLDSERALTLLSRCQTAQHFAREQPQALAELTYDGRHCVGSSLAQSLVESARHSVGRHRHPAFCAHVRILCEDLALMRRRILDLNKDLCVQVQQHPIASLLTTIDGIGDLTAAQLVATLGDPARFRCPGALASYVGAVPGTSRSGLHRPSRAALSSIGNARLRSALWMPTLAAVRRNPWLRAYYLRLLGRGKPPKVALVAAMRKLLVAIYVVAKRRSGFVARLESQS